MENKITRNTKWLLYSDDVEDMMGDEEERKANYRACCDTYPEEIDEDRLRSWCDACMQGYWEDFECNIDKDQYVLVIADLGLWYGRRDGGKTGKLGELLYQMFEEYNEIYYYPKDGHIHVKAVHHDGTNHYDIFGITHAGREYEDRDLWKSERTLHQGLLRNKKKYLCPITYTNL